MRRSEPDDRANLVVVDSVDKRRDQNDLHTRFVKVVNRPHLNVEQVANLAVAIRVIADAIELEIDITQSGCSSFTGRLAVASSSTSGHFVARLYRLPYFPTTASLRVLSYTDGRRTRPLPEKVEVRIADV